MHLQTLTPLDAFDVAYRMRDSDLEEISLVAGVEDRKEVAAQMQSAFEDYHSDGWVVLNKQGKRVAIIGWSRYPDKQTRARVGFFATDDFKTMKYSITKLIRKNLPVWAHELNLVRMDCQSLEDHTETHKWLECLGYKRGDILLNWANSGRNFINFEKQFNIM